MNLVAKIVPYSPEHRETWDAFCASSDDAWFWHTRDWSEWLCALLGDGVIADTSFMVREDKNILAIAPCMAYAGRDNQPARLGSDGYPVPWPAFSPQLDQQKRLEAERMIIAEYQHVATRHGLGRIELFGVVLANSYRRSELPPVNFPLRYGYLERAVDT